MKFTLKVAGKSQGYTYDTVKEHILQEIQEKLINGQELASNLREGVDKGISEQKLSRLKAPKIEIIGNVTAEKRKDAAEERRINQEGLDIKYRVKLEKIFTDGEDVHKK